MQLPPADELVLVSGLAPIRAKKLRYYEDRNFTSRVTAPPVLAGGLYRDRPASRRDDWTGQVRGFHEKLAFEAADTLAAAENEEGGLQQQRHPGLPEEQAAPPAEPDKEVQAGIEDESDEVADRRAMDRLRGLNVVQRAHAMNEGTDRGDDLLPSF